MRDVWCSFNSRLVRFLLSYSYTAVLNKAQAAFRLMRHGVYNNVFTFHLLNLKNEKIFVSAYHILEVRS